MKPSKRQILVIFFVTLALIMLLVDQEPPYTETGEASYYAMSLDGLPTANGEIYRHNSLTAAHITLPFNTKIEVENLANQKSVVVRINDRGPYAKDRILDLSRSAFKQLAPLSEGVIQVKITEIR